MTLPNTIYENRAGDHGAIIPWDTQAVHEVLLADAAAQTLRTTERALEREHFLPGPLKVSDVRDELGREPKRLVRDSLVAEAKRKRIVSLVIQLHHSKQAGLVLFANDGRLGRRWLYLKSADDQNELLEAVDALAGDKNTIVWPHGPATALFRKLVEDSGRHTFLLRSGASLRIATVAYADKIPDGLAVINLKDSGATSGTSKVLRKLTRMSHLDRLEADSIHIMREVAAQAESPVMLYSVGKDSSVMLNLAKKAFYPSTPPFPLMHVDTRWKFQAMYEFREKAVSESGMKLIVHVNPDGVAKNINPFDHGSALHTDIMKTEGLKQALEKYHFDVAFGGARRDEEKSRAKERVFSFRTRAHRWDPKNQRPELWDLYNGYKNEGESIRVFPLSNWTELDIWQYIYRENIPIVPLYFAADRPVVERDGMLLLVDDDRLKLFKNEKIKIRRVRFRTLGCYPLTGAIESEASDLSSIVLELLQSRTSERQGRAIDSDSSGSMEKKKREGYF
ncbi:MAG: sulfate adenylyltransferase subunit CysD [bacterium]|nr:sulfate adenylyltransferase subunit CysD [Gammaproteobacteria bacterium]HIL96954.1 sulfate adenylyltransferase subunit CysD [Pseudomonadales bacterium]